MAEKTTLNTEYLQKWGQNQEWFCVERGKIKVKYKGNKEGIQWVLEQDANYFSRQANMFGFNPFII